MFLVNKRKLFYSIIEKFTMLVYIRITKISVQNKTKETIIRIALVKDRS